MSQPQTENTPRNPLTIVQTLIIPALEGVDAFSRQKALIIAQEYFQWAATFAAYGLTGQAGSSGHSNLARSSAGGTKLAVRADSE